MRKILYVSGTRADYGLMRSVLQAIESHKGLKLEIIATGMHLMEEFGYTIREIERDNFVVHRIDAIFKEDSMESMALFLGEFIKKLIKKVKEIKPDVILVLGDRAEMLAAAIAGAYLLIPVAHLHGGEVTSTVDEFARHAITKLSHIHLPATNKSAERIKRMGENSSRIYVVGAPGLDQICNLELLSKNETFSQMGFDEKHKTALIVQHPVTIEIDEASAQMKETLEAVKGASLQAIVVYPNADAGGRMIIKMIESYRDNELFKIFKSIDHGLFLSIMKHSDLMMGNSSSGIIEAPSFKVPVINIGSRQEGRERADNIIDIDYGKEEILSAIEKAFSSEFKEKLKNCQNPYGDGKTGLRVAKILSEIKIDNELLQKRMSY